MDYGEEGENGIHMSFGVPNGSWNRQGNHCRWEKSQSKGFERHGRNWKGESDKVREKNNCRE